MAYAVSWMIQAGHSQRRQNVPSTSGSSSGIAPLRCTRLLRVYGIRSLFCAPLLAPISTLCRWCAVESVALARVLDVALVALGLLPGRP